MDIISKTCTNRRGAVMMYVVMALTVIAAIAISVTLVATNLYSRTAVKSSDEQAYLLAKSIGQCFAAEDTYSVNSIVAHLEQNPTDKVTAKATVYFDPATMATSANVNSQYLTALAVTDATIEFYLDKSSKQLFGDVTVNYNGATATATLVMTGNAPASHERNMADLFDGYDVYATRAAGSSMNMEAATGGEKPSFGYYNSSNMMENVMLQVDVGSNVKTNGPIAFLSNNTTTRTISGDIQAYGDLSLLKYLNVTGETYVNGKLTIGEGASKANTVAISGNIYCLSDVEVYAKANVDNKPISGSIYSEGNVSVINAVVSNIYSTAGTITVKGGTVDNISTHGNVVLENCTVKGTVYAGKLMVTNSSIAGNITVEGSSVVSAGSIMPNGDLEIYLTSSATADSTICSSITGSIYCSGNLKVSRYHATYNLTLNGNIEVGGGLSDPTNTSGYPYRSTINGNLVVHGGVKSEVLAGSPTRTEYYNLSYLIGLNVVAAGSGTGNVVLDWSVPMFMTKPSVNQVSSYNNTTARYNGQLASDRATSIAGTLFVCTNGAKSDGLAGSFALHNHYRTDGHADDGADIWLNGATLNNVMVGSNATYLNSSYLGDLAVWGGTIKGNVLAHDILLTGVDTQNSSQNFYARTSNGVQGDITLGVIYISGTRVQSTCSFINNAFYPADLNAAPSVTYYGVLDASGNITVGAGVLVAAGGDISSARDASIYGVVKCRVVLGNSVSNNSTLIIGSDALLSASGDPEQILYINGDMQCPGSTPRPAVAKAYLSGKRTVSGTSLPFSVIYQFTAQTDTVTPNCTIVYGTSVNDSTSLALTKTYAVIYDSTASGLRSDTASTQYVATSTLTSGKNLSAGSDNILYISCDCTINGDLVTAGYVVIREGVNVNIDGNLRARGVFTVSDAGGSYVGAPNGLTSVCTDTATAQMTLASVRVGGDVDITAEHAKVTVTQRSTINGNAIFATTGRVDLSNSMFNGNVSAINAAVYITDRAVCLGNLVAQTLRVEDSMVISCYVSGTTVQMVDAQFLDIFAPNARVDIRSSTHYKSFGANNTVVAKQLVAESDTTIVDRVYLLGDATSSFFYNSASGVIFSDVGDVELLSGSVYDSVDLYAEGGATFSKQGSPVVTLELTDEQLEELRANIETLTTAPHITSAVADSAANAEMLSVGDLLRAAFAYYAPTGVTGKVTPVAVAGKPQMSLTNDTYWGTQALPLKWVFPDGGYNTASTVEGERVRLNSSSDTATLSVAYNPLSVWSTAAAYVNDVWEGIKSAIKDNFELLHPIKSTRNAFLAAVENVKNAVVSMSAVSRFAGITMNTSADKTYYRYTATKYTQNIYPARKLSNGSYADMLITSVCYLSGDSTVYGKVRDFELLGIGIGKMLTDWLDEDHPTLSQVLKNIPWGNPKYIYRPCGVFFFNSGFVPAEAFNSYTTKNQTSYSKPSGDKYRSSYAASEKDSSGRWYWGGSGVTGTGSAADCTWTFFTCTDPANPYTSAAKDLHIVLPKHTYMAWMADKENCVHIIGNGRVFLYLQEDTNIKIVGNEWDMANEKQVFGGYRYVQTSGGKTVYYTSLTSKTASTVYNSANKSTRPVSVYLDYPYSSGRTLQPRMFIIGTGPHITFEVQDFNLAAYVYMPNGQNYDSSDWSGTAKNNTFIISNTSSNANVTSDVYGMYVADSLITSGYGNPSYKTRFFKTAVDLSDTTIYYGSSKVTTKRSTAQYKLSEFWDYPDNMPLAGMPFYYKGMAIH